MTVEQIAIAARRRRGAAEAPIEREAGAAARRTRLMVYALIFGLVLRLTFVVQSDFPLNDGGMFVQMVRDIQAAGFALPGYTHYNFAQMPFAYPPFGFYVVAVLDTLFPGHLIEWFRWLPLAVSWLTLLVAVRLASAVLRERTAVVGAAFCLAIQPDLFHWQIMGGGLTRSLGLLFAVAALHEVHQLYTTGQRRRLATASLCASLAVLSHLQWGFYTAFSAVVMWCCLGRSRRSLSDSLIVAGGVLGLTSVWWGQVLARHGLPTLLAPFAGNLHEAPLQMTLAYVLFMRLSSEVFFPAISMLGLSGALVCLKRREWFLPAWVAACLVLDHRSPLQSLGIPLSLLGGVALATVVMPLAASGRVDLESREGAAPDVLSNRWAVAAVLALLFPSALGSAITLRPDAAPLAPAEREAMAWIAAATEPDARLIVVSGDRWQVDRAGEWLPVLAERRAMSTVQGTEWLPNGGFATAIDRHQALNACAGHDVDCLEAWRAETALDYTHVYVELRPGTHVCCDGLRSALQRDPRYELVYNNAGAAIFKRNGG